MMSETQDQYILCLWDDVQSNLLYCEMRQMYQRQIQSLQEKL